MPVDVNQTKSRLNQQAVFYYGERLPFFLAFRVSGGRTPRAILESTRAVIPLLEYFDRERVTIRVGDKRQFRGRG